MTYLLDTNIFIILLEKSYHRLSARQRALIDDTRNNFLLSEASLYEIAIKVRLQKSDFAHIDITTIEQDRRALKIKLLKSTVAFYLNIPTVPKVLKNRKDVHGDPFDLLIISQAMVSGLAILSTDECFPKYQGLTVID